MAAGLNVALPRMLASRGGVAPVSMLDLDLTNPATGSLLVAGRTVDAWADRLDGTWQKFAPGVARVTDKGMLVEVARANLIDYSREITNAAWVKANTTVAKDQTGIDGVANSACSITATADLGTCVNFTSTSSGTRTFSAWIKRVSGSGTVEIQCQNNGFNPITITNNWVRYYITPGINVANGNSGFRLGTAGDVIAVDFCAVESGTINDTNATSPFETQAISVTRDQDDVRLDIAALGLSIGPVGSLVVHATPILGIVTTANIINIDDGTSSNRILISKAITTSSATAVIVIGGTNTGLTGQIIGTPWADVTLGKAGASFRPGSQFATKDGGAGVTASAANAPPQLSNVRFGHILGGTQAFTGYFKRLQLWDTQKTLAELQALTA